MRDYWESAASKLYPSLEEIRESEDWLQLASKPADVRLEAIAISELSALVARPTDPREDLVLLCLHGGGFITGSSRSHAYMYGHLASAVGCEAIILDYPLAPEQPFPAAVNACLDAYRRIAISAERRRVVLIGDSAGGNLAISVCLLATKGQLPSPVGVLLFSPWLDLSLGGRSLDGNGTKDPFFQRARLDALLGAYLPPGTDRESPEVSPLFGDLSSLPPVYIQAGEDEGLLDDSTRFAAAVRASGLPAELQVFPGMPHVFQATVGRDKVAGLAIDAAARWISRLISKTDA